MSGNGSDETLEHPVEPGAQTSAIDSDRSAADADQDGADVDQTASDTDQTASERDEADAVSDQRAADIDQATADGDQGGADPHAPGATIDENDRASSRAARDATRASRLATHATRLDTAESRFRIAVDRDATGLARDEIARLRDLRTEAMEGVAADTDAPLAEKFERLRVAAAHDRARAAADRARASADRAHAAAERAALEAELHEAHLDELTGAFRRKLGMVSLSHEIDRARRADGRLVCAFVDVDHLKLVNDRDGHAAGDRVLQALVSIMRGALRSFDPIVRYGGDEFVCALGGADLAEVAQRLAVIDRALKREVGTGISVGLASLAADERLEGLMARADMALLDAKRQRVA